MNLIVFGATGGTGRHVVEQALAAGHCVTAVARNPAALAIQHERLAVVHGDVFDPDTFARRLDGQDAVVSALGVRTREPTTVYSAGVANRIQQVSTTCLYTRPERAFGRSARRRVTAGRNSMQPLLILTLNLLGSTLMFWVAARIYILPKLHTLKPQRILLPILLLHSTRHLGLMFLSPGATYPGIAPQFAYPAALGDLLAAMLAFTAIPAVATNHKAAPLLVWIFNIEGTLDLVVAIALATVYGAPAYMGPAYWIPAIWVPALLVTHYITFLVLRTYRTGAV